MKIRRLLLLLVCLALWSCKPSHKSIAERFKNDHPAVVVVAVRTGIGDSDGLEYFIDYKSSSSDTQIKTAEWLVHYGVLSGWGYSEDTFQK